MEDFTEDILKRFLERVLKEFLDELIEESLKGLTPGGIPEELSARSPKWTHGRIPKGINLKSP